MTGTYEYNRRLYCIPKGADVMAACAIVRSGTIKCCKPRRTGESNDMPSNCYGVSCSVCIYDLPNLHVWNALQKELRGDRDMSNQRKKEGKMEALSMSVEDFNEVLSARLEKTQAVLGSKAKEYSGVGNRLHNFDVAARTKGEGADEALWGMFMKHFVSIQDIVQGDEVASEELVNEKIGDAVCYLVLLEAVWKAMRDRDSELKLVAIDGS